MYTYIYILALFLSFGTWLVFKYQKIFFQWNASYFSSHTFPTDEIIHAFSSTWRRRDNSSLYHSIPWNMKFFPTITVSSDYSCNNSVAQFGHQAKKNNCPEDNSPAIVQCRYLLRLGFSGTGSTSPGSSSPR